MEKRNAFTLIELMLVVVIIGVLVAMVVPRLTGRAKEARVMACRADIEINIPMALDLFEVDNGFFPTTEQGLNALLIKPGSSPVPTNWNGPYLKKLSKDPWGNEYKYVSPGNHSKDYDLYSYGQNGAEGGGDDISNWETTSE